MIVREYDKQKQEHWKRKTQKIRFQTFIYSPESTNNATVSEWRLQARLLSNK